MINLRSPLLVYPILFLVFISSSFLFATPSFAARIGRGLVQEEVTKIPEYKLEEPEIPEEPELPEVPEEPEEPEVPEEPEQPEIPEEPEQPPEEPEEPKFEFPSWIPSFPFPGGNGGIPKTEKEKTIATVEEIDVKSSSGSVSNKKP